MDPLILGAVALVVLALGWAMFGGRAAPTLTPTPVAARLRPRAGVINYYQEVARDEADSIIVRQMGNIEAQIFAEKMARAFPQPMLPAPVPPASPLPNGSSGP